MTTRVLSAVCFGMALIASLVDGSLRAQGGDRHPVSAEQYQRWKTELSNWGRWGKEDQIGALNLITPEKRRQAAALVKEGVSVSLAADADTVKAVDNPNPYEVTMQGIGADRIAINYHGIAHTHLDSLAHINEQGVFYNGYKPEAEAVAKDRHAKNSIHNVKNGVLTRGILIDIPRLKGRAVSRTRNADLRGRPRGVGETGRREGLGRRCAVRAHRGVGEAEGGRSVAARPRRGRAVSGTAPVGAAVAEGA